MSKALYEEMSQDLGEEFVTEMLNDLALLNYEIQQ